MRKKTSAVADAVMNSSETKTTAQHEAERAVAEQVDDAVAGTIGGVAREIAGAASRRARSNSAARATAANVPALTSMASSVPPSAASTPARAGPAVIPT